MSRCDECSSVNGHRAFCSQQTREQAMFNAKMIWDTNLINQKCISHLRKQITQIQGKCAVLKNENNKLRNKLFRKPTTSESGERKERE